MSNICNNPCSKSVTIIIFDFKFKLFCRVIILFWCIAHAPFSSFFLFVSFVLSFFLLKMQIVKWKKKEMSVSSFSGLVSPFSSTASCAIIILIFMLLASYGIRAFAYHRPYGFFKLMLRWSWDL